ncbi:hypothetical protein RFI_02283 [Reticulomyxa filosa]|uniref:Uncharacterized protein n=1 Tax=Reticulomyxa filosa TaxID=46433 RepID=X6P9Q5_RETFI|nr:hypothetical protein RFI_02283 [Reticulomyxa filosa]|eukprot:ETO34804.1 hypothetical protein RFI_02283 [Reticulomyxa filosa]
MKEFITINNNNNKIDDDEEEIKRIEEEMERRRLKKEIEDYLRKIESIRSGKKIIYYLNRDEIPKEGKYIYIFLLNKNEVFVCLFVCVCIEKRLVPTYIHRQTIEELTGKKAEILYNIFVVVFYSLIAAASIYVGYFAISNMNWNWTVFRDVVPNNGCGRIYEDGYCPQSNINTRIEYDDYYYEMVEWLQTVNIYTVGCKEN